MAWFHVHTPLFTNRTNGGRSDGGKFGDNVEELDDSVGTLVAGLQRHDFTDNTLIFLTSDNGPYGNFDIIDSSLPATSTSFWSIPRVVVSPPPTLSVPCAMLYVVTER